MAQTGDRAVASRIGLLSARAPHDLGCGAQKDRLQTTIFGQCPNILENRPSLRESEIEEIVLNGPLGRTFSFFPRFPKRCCVLWGVGRGDQRARLEADNLPPHSVLRVGRGSRAEGLDAMSSRAERRRYTRPSTACRVMATTRTRDRPTLRLGLACRPSPDTAHPRARHASTIDFASKP